MKLKVPRVVWVAVLLVSLFQVINLGQTMYYRHMEVNPPVAEVANTHWCVTAVGARGLPVGDMFISIVEPHTLFWTNGTAIRVSTLIHPQGMQIDVGVLRDRISWEEPTSGRCQIPWTSPLAKDLPTAREGNPNTWLGSERSFHKKEQSF